MSTNQEESKKPGEIDLIRLFEAEAIELLSAAERGKVLHATKNIRESGGPLEGSFRALLQAKLPSVYRTVSGYLFDARSACTPQIDAIVVHGEECHELMTSSGGASYMPFAGALAVAEVKNTTYDVAASLDQLSAILESIASMRTAAAQDSGVRLPKLLSVVLFADSKRCDIASFQSWYAAHGPRNSPTYTVLLDKGLILAYGPSLLEVCEDGLDFVGFRDHNSPGRPYLCGPGEQDYRRGRTLLWLYLAIADHLSTSNKRDLASADHLSESDKRDGYSGFIRAFTAKAQQTYAFKHLTALDSLREWPRSE